MKRKTFAMILFITPYFLFAQFSVGLKIAIPFFNGNRPFGNFDIENTTISEKGYFPIINIGGFIHYSFNNPLALQAEIKYTYEGFHYSVGGFNNQNTFTLQFIEIPLLFQCKWGNEFQWFGQTGISLKYLMASEYFLNEVEGEAEKKSIYNYTNIIDNKINKFIIKANIGTGFMWNFWKNLIFTGELRFGYDIMPIIDDIRFLKMELTIGVAYKFK
jgi:hypothetical protein